jgi:hypothetical protein
LQYLNLKRLSFVCDLARIVQTARQTTLLCESAFFDMKYPAIRDSCALRNPMACCCRVHRGLINTLASRFKLPAVYQERLCVAGGGLTPYGSNFLDQFRRAAGYVDCIFKGETPADLPQSA